MAMPQGIDDFATGFPAAGPRRRRQMLGMDDHALPWPVDGKRGLLGA